MRLAGRHAVVTGGGTGIGAAIAAALAAEGARLTLVGRRQANLERQAEQLHSSRAESRGGVPVPFDFASDERFGIDWVVADVTDRAQVDAAFAAARQAHGPVAILVNNAGAAESAPFGKVTTESWRRIFAVNADALLHTCQAALPDLLAADRGRIVTVASVAGLRGFAYAAPYIAAKHAAVGLTRALAAEFARTSLRINAVCPGFVDTDMTVGSVATIRAKTGRSEAEARAELAALNPSGRLIKPDEVAAAVIELILADRNGEALEIA